MTGKRKRYEGYHSPDRCRPVFSSTNIRSTACQTSSSDTGYNTSSASDLTSSTEKSSAVYNKSSSVSNTSRTSKYTSSRDMSSTRHSNKGYLKKGKIRSLEDDVQLMAIFGDKDVKHLWGLRVLYNYGYMV